MTATGSILKDVLSLQREVLSLTPVANQRAHRSNFGLFEKLLDFPTDKSKTDLLRRGQLNEVDVRPDDNDASMEIAEVLFRLVDSGVLPDEVGILNRLSELLEKYPEYVGIVDVMLELQRQRPLSSELVVAKDGDADLHGGFWDLRSCTEGVYLMDFPFCGGKIQRPSTSESRRTDELDEGFVDKLSPSHSVVSMAEASTEECDCSGWFSQNRRTVRHKFQCRLDHHYKKDYLRPLLNVLSRGYEGQSSESIVCWVSWESVARELGDLILSGSGRFYSLNQAGKMSVKRRMGVCGVTLECVYSLILSFVDLAAQ